MKIRVIRANHTQEVITLTEPLTIIRREAMNRIATSTGMEHWFTEEGIYDGWGMNTNITVPEPPGNSLPQEAAEFIEQIEKDREFPR